uniref:Uncharacterized protein n=1 Tax=Timema bartmani TaxID=61472 RepID=A0A7R9EQW6_9NEOP|nr:unnamed protein product [Timema bartmani]
MPLRLLVTDIPYKTSLLQHSLNTVLRAEPSGAQSSRQHYTYTSVLASVVLTDSLQLTYDGFEKLPDQIMNTRLVDYCNFTTVLVEEAPTTGNDSPALPNLIYNTFKGRLITENKRMTTALLLSSRHAVLSAMILDVVSTAVVLKLGPAKSSFEMVSRYGGRKPESTVHCFMPHCAHPPPQHHQQHPPPPLSQFRIISANTGRPEVSFHVAGPTYPSQQGGGAGPPGGPQLRGLHHPHHGGNPALPPPHQQQPPPQSQHSGGPPGPGPAPTSTPPGPADMNKQGPPHMQGQQQIQQGQQMQINYAVPSQSRPAGAQGYFTGPRGPAPPRIPTHRAQVVNMPTNNVGQQMFSPHQSPSDVAVIPQVQMQQIPQIYANQVVPAQLHPSQSMVFSQGQLPVFPGQPRHQNHVGTGFYTQGSHHQILMTTQQPLYQNYPTHATQAGAQYYYAANPVNLARPGATPGPGVAGTGLAGATAQQVVPGVPQPPSIAQAGQIPLGMVATSGLNMAAMPGDGGTVANPVVGSNIGKQPRRRFALDIVDPKTGKNVLFDDNNGTTPPRSGDSSSRETPQLNTGPGGMDVAAEFAARVAKVASEKSSPPPPQAPYLESPLSLDSVAQIVTVNGPDANTNNLLPQDDISQPDSAFSKHKMVALEEPNAWKQSQSSNVGNISSASNKHQSETNLVKTNIKIESDNNSNVVNQVIHINVRDSMAVAEIAQQSPVIVNIEPMQVEVPLQPPTPVVSALTNNPAVDVIHHKAGLKEPFPALKPVTTSVGSTSLNVQSPRRKRVDGAPTSSDKMGGPLTAAFVPSTPIQTVPVSVAPVVDARQREPSLPPANPTVPVVEAKPQKKSPSPTVLSEDAPVFIVLPQKEKKEEKPKEREKIAQIKELDKSLQNRGKDKTSQVKEQSRGREKSSQDKEKASQPHFRDREKSSPSHGHNKDTPPPTPTETVQGEILPPMPVVVKPLLSAPIVEHKQANGETTPEGSEGES